MTNAINFINNRTNGDGTGTGSDTDVSTNFVVGRNNIRAATNSCAAEVPGCGGSNGWVFVLPFGNENLPTCPPPPPIGFFRQSQPDIAVQNDLTETPLLLKVYPNPAKDVLTISVGDNNRNSSL